MTASASGREAKRVGLQSRGQAFILLVLTNACWAGAYVAGKVALRYVTPIELNTVRFSIAALLLSPVIVRERKRIPRNQRALLMLALLALLGFVFSKLFEYVGLSLSTASDVALLIATESLFTALLSWTFFHERVTRTGIAALVVGMFGVYLIVERGFIPTLSAPGTNAGARVIGDLLVIFSLLIESGYTTLGKKTVASLPPLLFTALTITGSLFVWLPAGALSVAHSGWPVVPWEGWLAIGYMAVIATVFGYWMWFRALTTLDASVAAPALFIQPLLGVALAIWLLGDALTWATLLGGALICVSLALVMRRGARRSDGPALTTLDDLGEATP